MADQNEQADPARTREEWVKDAVHVDMRGDHAGVDLDADHDYFTRLWREMLGNDSPHPAGPSHAAARAALHTMAADHQAALDDEYAVYDRCRQEDLEQDELTRIAEEEERADFMAEVEADMRNEIAEEEALDMVAEDEKSPDYPDPSEDE